MTEPYTAIISLPKVAMVFFFENFSLRLFTFVFMFSPVSLVSLC
jgi:hypothetical protein